MSQTIDAEAQAALEFLAQQRLAAIPRNYALAWQALHHPDSALGRAMQEIMTDGIRLRQGDADRLFNLFGAGSLGIEIGSAADKERTMLRHQILQVSEAASDVADCSGELGRSLASDASHLGTASPQSIAMLTALAERALKAETDLKATALRVEMLREELGSAKDDAMRDALTGLPNRRGIEAYLQRLAALGDSRMICICDIDHFKSINDRFGHPVGDRVLKMVGGFLAEERDSCFAGRWGGEEFLIVLPGNDLSAARCLLDKRRAELATREFKVRETDEPLGRVTFSAGVALASGEHAATLEALSRADAALYQAKAAGRNRVFLAGERAGPAEEELAPMLRAG